MLPVAVACWLAMLAPCLLCVGLRRGNLAWSLGPRRWCLMPPGCCGRCPSSTSRGGGRARFGGGRSSHCWMCASLPCPMARLGLALGAGLACCRDGVACGCCACNRAGSCLCVGHACHGSSHAHCQCLTKRDFWHWLHQMRASRLLRWKAFFVPGNLCGHLGH